MRSSTAAVFLVLCLVAALAPAQESAADWSVAVGVANRVVPDITYLVADGYESKLDVFAPHVATEKRPTLIYIHGGGWVGGDKDSMGLIFLPYLEMGYAVVNVEYRLAREALAPAAVEDCRCALRWVYDNADEYGFDTEKIVVTGHSAGGHLSLTTGMLTAAAGFDRRCPPRLPGGADTRPVEMPVAAVVNWFGITDVGDLIEGDNAKTYAVAWMGSLPNQAGLAAQLSPLHYVRADLPPILTIHGDADNIVPYAHATRLHEALRAAGAKNRLHTVPGGGHGTFSPAQYQEAFAVIREFLGGVIGGAS